MIFHKRSNKKKLEIITLSLLVIALAVMLLIFRTRDGVLVRVVTIFVGITASLSFIPQIAKIAHRQDVEEISLPTFFILVINACTWFLYGWHIGDTPLIATSGFAIVLTGTIVLEYFKYKK